MQAYAAANKFESLITDLFSWSQRVHIAPFLPLLKPSIRKILNELVVPKSFSELCQFMLSLPDNTLESLITAHNAARKPHCGFVEDYFTRINILSNLGLQVGLDNSAAVQVSQRLLCIIQADHPESLQTLSRRAKNGKCLSVLTKVQDAENVVVEIAELLNHKLDLRLNKFVSVDNLWIEFHKANILSVEADRVFAKDISIEFDLPTSYHRLYLPLSNYTLLNSLLKMSNQQAVLKAVLTHEALCKELYKLVSANLDLETAWEYVTTQEVAKLADSVDSLLNTDGSQELCTTDTSLNLQLDMPKVKARL